MTSSNGSINHGRRHPSHLVSSWGQIRFFWCDVSLSELKRHLSSSSYNLARNGMDALLGCADLVVVPMNHLLLPFRIPQKPKSSHKLDLEYLSPTRSAADIVQKMPHIHRRRMPYMLGMYFQALFRHNLTVAPVSVEQYQAQSHALQASGPVRGSRLCNGPEAQFCLHL